MKQTQFVALNQATWTRIAAHIAAPKAIQSEQGQARAQLVQDYRALCQHLAIARTRAYSPLLVNELEDLTRSTHHLLYQVKTLGHARAMTRFFTDVFPQTVRREWRAVALAALLFFGVGIVTGLMVYFKPDLIYLVMGHGEVESMREMYAPDNPMVGRLHENFNQSRMEMFGFYVYNNTGIGLRVFATGVLWGIGSIVSLVMNALSIGAVAGYLTQLGYIKTFWGFVAGHSAFELGAITLSGAAGLMLGRGVIAASTQKRMDFLTSQARRALPMIAGAALMFVLAAFIEGFWSPAPSIPVWVKYIVGVSLITLTVAYFVFAGRDSEWRAADLGADIRFNSAQRRGVVMGGDMGGDNDAA